jgi:hypothetical protein
MSRDLGGAAILGLGMVVVVALGIIAPPRPAGRDIWVVSSSEKNRSRPQLVRAAHPDHRTLRVAFAQ